MKKVDVAKEMRVALSEVGVEVSKQMDAHEVMTAILDRIVKLVEAGEKVPTSIGTFEQKHKNERKSLANPRQPELGTKIVPAKDVLSLRTPIQF